MKFLTSDYSFADTVGNYRIDSARKLRVEEYHGKVVLADLKSMLSAMVSDPCWSADFNGLVDLSQASLDLSANDVLRLALVMKHEPNRTRGWQVYVATNPTTFGIVRMLGYWSRSTDRLRIFADRADAERWLDRKMNQSPGGFVDEVQEEPLAMREAV